MYRNSEMDTKIFPRVVILDLYKTLPKQREYSLIFQSCTKRLPVVHTLKDIHDISSYLLRYITFQPHELVKIFPDNENHK